MSGGDETGRGAPTVGDTLPGEAATPLPEGAEIAPGVVLDPETRQPMDAPAGADAPPTAPPELVGLPVDDAERAGQ